MMPICQDRPFWTPEEADVVLEGLRQATDPVRFCLRGALHHLYALIAYMDAASVHPQDEEVRQMSEAMCEVDATPCSLIMTMTAMLMREEERWHDLHHAPRQ